MSDQVFDVKEHSKLPVSCTMSLRKGDTVSLTKEGQPGCSIQVGRDGTYLIEIRPAVVGVRPLPESLKITELT